MSRADAISAASRPSPTSAAGSSGWLSNAASRPRSYVRSSVLYVTALAAAASAAAASTSAADTTPSRFAAAAAGTGAGAGAGAAAAAAAVAATAAAAAPPFFPILTRQTLVAAFVLLLLLPPLLLPLSSASQLSATGNSSKSTPGNKIWQVVEAKQAAIPYTRV